MGVFSGKRCKVLRWKNGRDELQRGEKELQQRETQIRMLVNSRNCGKAGVAIA